MTNAIPQIFINRLIIYRSDKSLAYDEKFHEGVNIIRGRNSTGKSTIADFIFFALGGDVKTWKTEALNCENVYLELELNEVKVTLKRKVSINSRASMSIYWGTFEQSLTDLLNWHQYPYNKTAQKISFSSVLLNVLKIPIVSNDSDNTVTLNQLLRLIYIDQETSSQSLFKFEHFDTPLNRETISELLLGIYDDSLYELRIKYKEKKKELDEVNRELKFLNNFLAKDDDLKTSTDILKSIGLSEKTLIKNKKELNHLKSQRKIVLRLNSKLEIQKIQDELKTYKTNLRSINEELNALNVSIMDSTYFIDTLKDRVSELENSISIKKILGEIELSYCPKCLKLLKHEVKNSCCSLCQQELNDSDSRANAVRIKQQMLLQIKESQVLIKERKTEQSKLINKLNILINKTKLKQKELDENIDSADTTRNQKIEKLLLEQGRLKELIVSLNSDLKRLEFLKEQKKKQEKLTIEIKNINEDISKKETNQLNKKTQGFNAINRVVDYLLKNDLPLQKEFLNPGVLNVNYNKNYYSLDGINNFSASSNIILKNSILFALFFSSVNNDFFRYPRFILCDNIEDKGMEDARSQNFQRKIVKLSKGLKKKHQIIFTTSKIDKSLDKSDYTIGEYLTPKNRSLK